MHRPSPLLARASRLPSFSAWSALTAPLPLTRRRQLEVARQQRCIAKDFQPVGGDALPEEEQQVRGGAAQGHIAPGMLTRVDRAIRHEAYQPLARTIGAMEMIGLAAA